MNPMGHESPEWGLTREDSSGISFYRSLTEALFLEHRRGAFFIPAFCYYL